MVVVLTDSSNSSTGVVVPVGDSSDAGSSNKSTTSTTPEKDPARNLTHAFEALYCIAVEFRTHRLNTQSRRAIERLGAQLDGVLRAHQRSPNGTLRDTAVYSITATEWPTVRAHLDGLLARPD